MDHKSTEDKIRSLAEDLMRDEGMDERSALASARERLEASQERTEDAIRDSKDENFEHRDSPETVDPPVSRG
ncbi:MAG: hypothetical protein ACLGH3_08185 [Actinomycetota bacterium]